MRIIVLLVYLLVGLAANANAQIGMTGVPFIQIEPTAQGMQTGGAGSASPSEHPSSFFYNPAHLGFTGYHESISVSGYFHGIDWLPQINHDMTYTPWSAAGGINLANELGIPLSVGLGYQRVNFDLGTQILNHPNFSGEFNPQESFHMYGIGLHLDYPVTISLGYSRKQISSKLAPLEIADPANTTAYDLGILLGFTHQLAPFDMRVATSYVMRNIGDDVSYGFETDPLPRMAVWGYEVSVGHTIVKRNIPMKLAQIDWTLEAQDLLVEYTGVAQTRYTRWPGNISLFDNVLLGKHDDQVTVRRGARIHMMELFSAGIGSFKGPGYPERVDTRGFTISSDGLLMLIAMFSNKPDLSRINDRITITFSNTKISPEDSNHPLSGTRYRDIAVRWTWR